MMKLLFINADIQFRIFTIVVNFVLEMFLA